jgi:drug/metabolite transporter superfamily protein YnfA
MEKHGTFSLLSDLWAFLRTTKKWWLSPIIVVMLLFGFLLIFAETSALAPFIYTVF